MAQSHQPGMDGLITIIAHRLLASAYPDRHFWNLYLRDRGERFSPQSVMFVDGSHYNYATSPEYAGVRWGSPTRSVSRFPASSPTSTACATDVTAGPEGRASCTTWPPESSGEDWWRACRRRSTRSPRGRLTSSRISDYVFQAMRVRIGAIVSPCTAYSADVDEPAHAERYLKE